MRKDIFIDNNIAKNLTNPLSEEYKDLKDWLMHFDQNDSSNCAVLVLSPKILNEYKSTSDYSYKENISVIINLMNNQNRINKFSNLDIKKFQNKHFKKKQKFRCNKKDQNHIPIVLMSDRKMALTADNNFKYDLINFPGFKNVIVEKKPSLINYK